jgi:hypothetical protein
LSQTTSVLGKRRRTADIVADASHPSYVNKKGRVDPTAVVPESCIESTETILRKADDPAYKFTMGGQGSTPKKRKAMWVHLKRGGNSVALNVSDADKDEIFAFGKDKISLWPDDARLNSLQLGQGVAFLRRSGDYDENYNMHFMGLIKKQGANVTLSDVSEQEEWDNASQVALATVTATTVADLREKLGTPYDNSTQFAFGVVSLKEDDADISMKS